MPTLISLLTDLSTFNYYDGKGSYSSQGNFGQKKIPYGQDRFDNGNSKQPWIQTPIPDSFLNGITRRCIIDIAKTKGIKVVERKIKTEEMKNFVGCFLTGTAAEVTPVSQIDKYKFTVCDLIKNLSQSYQALVRKKTAA